MGDFSAKGRGLRIFSNADNQWDLGSFRRLQGYPPSWSQIRCIILAWGTSNTPQTGVANYKGRSSTVRVSRSHESVFRIGM